MSSTKIIILSGTGIITNAIVDSMSEQFEVQRIYLREEDVRQTIILEKELLSKADIIILNLSEIITSNEELLRLIKKMTLAPIIVLHLYQQKIFTNAFLKMGASAYLPVDFNTLNLLSTIEDLLENKPQKVNIKT